MDDLIYNATFSNISAISWRPVLVVEEAGVTGENNRPWASNWLDRIICLLCVYICHYIFPFYYLDIFL